MLRPLRNYNVEERALKEISNEKPKPAPPYPVMKKIMEDIKKGTSNFILFVNVERLSLRFIMS